MCILTQKDIQNILLSGKSKVQNSRYGVLSFEYKRKNTYVFLCMHRISLKSYRRCWTWSVLESEAEWQSCGDRVRREILTECPFKFLVM